MLPPIRVQFMLNHIKTKSTLLKDHPSYKDLQYHLPSPIHKPSIMGQGPSYNK